MLFKIVAAASFLATFAAGYVIPVEALSSRSLGVVDDSVDLFVRTHTIPAGSYHPEHTYTDEHITAAVHAAQAQHAKHATMTPEEIQHSPLRHFGNYDHVDPNTHIPGDHGTKPFLKRKSGSDSHMVEYPLPNLHNPKAVGPARIILHHTKDGELKYAGVVSHDQSRGANHPGVSDHFRIART